MAPSTTYESGHFYFAQIGYSHFAATSDAKSCQREVEMSALSASKVSSKGVLQVHGIWVCFAFWVSLKVAGAIAAAEA
jgi:hypothetical protein